MPMLQEFSVDVAQFGQGFANFAFDANEMMATTLQTCLSERNR